MSYQRLIGPHKKSGPKSTTRRQRVAAQFGLTGRAASVRLLTAEIMDQLDKCKNIAARRILLGVSK